MRVLSARLAEVRAGVYRHWCPACDTYHDICTSQPTSRITYCIYDGEHESPTFSPAVRVRHGEHLVCHYFLSEGILHFCEDSDHSLAGVSVELSKLPISAFRASELPTAFSSELSQNTLG